MNAAPLDARMSWRAAAQREAQAMRTLVLAVGAAGACAAILLVSGAAMGTLGGQALHLLVGFGTLALALVWTFLFVPGSIRMNSPANAWLLPRQRRCLLQMTMAYWVLATAGMTFGIGHWIALPAVALSVLGLRAAALAAAQALAVVGPGKLAGTTAWPWPIVMSLAVCVVKLRLDWKRMLAAPPAFPAGRMA